MQCMITNLLTYLTERAALYSGEVDVKQGQEVFFWKICQWGQSLMPWRLILVEIFLAFVYLLDIYKWLYISAALETSIYREERIRAVCPLQIDFLGATLQIDFLGATQDINATFL